MRRDGRTAHDLRPVRITRGFTLNAPGSVLIETGETRVLCTASVTDSLPRWLHGKGHGWITAEYSMLPASGGRRKARDRAGRVDGRSVEIQRLIGRCLRAITDLAVLPERSFWLDCDVLQADGGTRTAALTGAYVALHDCLAHLKETRNLRAWPLRTQIAAVSVGIVDGEPLLDLDYSEDSTADADMVLAMTGNGKIVEVQGGAEKHPFSPEAFFELIEMARGGVEELLGHQAQALGLEEAG